MFRLAARSVIAPVARRSALVAAPRMTAFAVQRSYSAAAGLDRKAIESRVLEVISSFEKASADKISPTASFTNDLGLDSLDAVEVVMAIEEEFSIEIPDEEADRITTIAEAIDYISRSPEAH